MKSKCKTRAVLAFMTMLVLLGLFRIVYIVEASPEVVVYVDPPEVVDVNVGDSFDIYVTASDVTDLFLGEFYLSWDPRLLYTDVDNINIGDVAPYLDFIYIEEVNNDEGWLKATVGRPIGIKEGLSGTVQIAKITFLVEGEGSCALHLYDTRLKDVAGNDLDHTTKDGRFGIFIETHDIAISSVGAYPTTVTPGQPVYIDVEVVNEGTVSETFDVTVYYNSTVIATTTVWQLPAEAYWWLGFDWDTTGVAEGVYAISVEAEVVPGETDTADNVYVNGIVTVGVPKITINPSSGPIGTKVAVKGSGFPYGMSGYLMFDDELVGFIFADLDGNFNAALNVPLSEAGPHAIKAIIPYYYPYYIPYSVEATFTVIDVTPLEIEMDVGTLYFKGETAEFYVQTALKGTPVDVTSIDALLYKPDETTEALSVQRVATGLYKMTYAIRGKGSMKGTYTLVVEASYTTSTVNATGTSIKAFLVKDAYKTWEKEAPTALSLIAAFGAISALVVVWRRKESTNPLQ